MRANRHSLSRKCPYIRLLREGEKEADWVEGTVEGADWVEGAVEGADWVQGACLEAVR